MARNFSHGGLCLAGIELFWDTGVVPGLGDLSRKLDASRHVLARVVGGKAGLLHGMERFLGDELVTKLQGIADEDLPALDRIRAVLTAIVCDQLSGEWFPSGPVAMGELRSEVGSILHRLVLEGMVGGSIAGYDVAGAVSMLLDGVGPFHTWTGAPLSAVMERNGMDHERVDDDYRRRSAEIPPMFERRWALLHRALSV